MDHTAWRVKLSVLWLITIANYLSYMLTIYIETGAWGMVSQRESATAVPIIIFLSCLLAWLSLIAKVSIIRWLSIIMGLNLIFLRLGVIVIGASGPSEALPNGLSLGVFINEFWGTLFAVLIIWYSWKAPSTNNQVKT